MRSKERKAIDVIYSNSEAIFRKIKYKNISRKTLKSLNGGYRGYDRDFNTVVVPYWKKFGVRPNKLWYRLYCNEEKPLDPRYIPNDMWFSKIIPYYNNTFLSRALQDKCLFTLFLPGIKQPDTIIRNVAGVFYDKDFNLVSSEQAASLCEAAGSFIIKPSLDNGQGKAIQFFDSETMNREDIVKMFNDLNNNFIVQRIVKQHRVLKEINNTSLNTLRVLSFFFKGEVHILSVILRMGTGASKVDNVSAGGLQCNVLSDGMLNSYAQDKSRNKYLVHPNSGVRFSDIKVPSYDKVISAVKKEHKKIAHFRILGWDFAVDEAGEPVFLEYNVYPGQNQMTGGPTFSELTDMVLEDVFINKELKYSKN